MNVRTIGVRTVIALLCGIVYLGALDAQEFHYTLDGTLDDQSSNPAPRVFGTGPSYGPGVTGNAGDQGLVLNDDFGFDVTNGAATQMDFTLSCWIRIDAAQDVCCGGSAYWMGTALFQGEVAGVVADSGLSIAGGTGNLAAFGIGDPGVADTTIMGTTALDDGEWHLITATRSIGATESDLRLYIDGQLEVSGTSPYIGASDANPVWEVGLGQTRGLVGNMDDVRVYGVALSDAEIQALFIEQMPLVRYYPMDGTVDNLGGDNDPPAGVSFGGTPVYVQGATDEPGDQALLLDNTYGLDMPNEVPFDFTLSCWVRFDAPQAVCCGGPAWWAGTALFQGEIAGAHNNSGLTISGDGTQASFGTGNPMTALFSPSGLDDGEWHMLTGTRSVGATESELKLYVDGVEEASGTSSNIGALDANNIWGVGKQGQNRGLIGELDEVRIYAAALSGPQIQALFETTSPPLVRYYPVDGTVDNLGSDNDPAAIVSFGGTPVYVTGVSGEPGDSALRLDNTYGLDMPNEVPFDFTLSCWVRFDAPQAVCCGGPAWWAGTALFQGEIAGAHNNSGLTISGDGTQASFGTGNPMTAIFSSSGLDDGQWHMLTGTRFINTDTGMAELNLYVDGAQAASGMSTNIGPLDANNIWGVGKQGQNRGLMGDMDEIRIYSTALSAAAVAGLFDDTKPSETVIPLARRYTGDGTVNDAVTGEGPLAVSGTGTAVYTCGVTGNDQAFGMDNDFGLDVPNDASTQNDFSLSCWVRFDVPQAVCCGGPAWWAGTALFQGEIAGTHNNSGMTISGDGTQASFGTGNPMTAIFSPSGLDDGEWHLITGTREIDTGGGVSNLSLYVDGQLVDSTTSPNIGPLDANDRWGLGRQGQNRGLVGDLDDARIYRVALTSAEVEALYLGGNPLVRHYPVDGDVNDVVTGDPPLAVSGTGTPVYTQGVTDDPGDQAFQLNNDYGIDVANTSSTHNDFTLSCWARFDVPQAVCCGGPAWWAGTALFQGEIAGTHNNSGMSISGDGTQASFGTGNPMTAIFSPSGLDDGVWHMITGTREIDAAGGVSDLTLYVDGEVAGTATSSNIGPLDANDRWGVGRQGQNRGLVGDMDDMRVYGKALSAIEVQALFNASIPFVSHYPLDGTLEDVQSGFDGALTGAGGPIYVIPGATGEAGDQALALADNYGFDVPNNVPNDFTLSCWVRVEEEQDSCCGGSAFWMGTSLFQGEVAGDVDDSGLTMLGAVASFGIGNPDTTIIGTTDLTDGEWHLVTATRSVDCDAGVSDLTLYVDGQVDVSGTAPNTGPLTSNSIWGVGTGQTRGLIGDLDDARIYARALSQPEVQALFEGPPVNLQRPGDFNQDGSSGGTGDVVDVRDYLEWLFEGDTDPTPPCGGDTASFLTLMDSNGDGQLDQSDAVWTMIGAFLETEPNHAQGASCIELPDCADICTDAG